MNSETPLPSWLTALLETAGAETLILRAGDPPYVVRAGAACHLGTVPLTRIAIEALGRDILPDVAARQLASSGSVRLTVNAQSHPVEVKADRLDDDLVVRVRRLDATAPHASAADATADLVAALGAAAKTQEVEAAIDSLRQRLQASSARREMDRRDSVAPAPVVDLHRRREIATDRFTLDDWVAEGMARGARTLYLPVGGAPFVKIEGQVTAFASDVLPLSMFEQAAAAMTDEADGWSHTPGELEWSKHVPGAGTIRCQAFSDARGGGLVVHLPTSQPIGLEPPIPAHIRTACEAGDGLVIISAPFADDVAVMVATVLAWHAKRRPGYVIAFGREPGFDRLGRAFVSERQPAPTAAATAAAIEHAVRERPDVLAIVGDNDLHGPEAIVRAAVGRLVIVGVVARTAPRALHVLLKDLMSPEGRTALADVFTSGCSWRRVRRPRGQSVVLADSLVTTAHVAALIRDGDIAGLERAQREGEDGMRSVDAALAGAVARKKITLREAAAAAVDRKTLIRLVRAKTRDQHVVAPGRVTDRSRSSA
jgi:Tfp pilus assembly pilus retraction ATPase PilT